MRLTIQVSLAAAAILTAGCDPMQFVPKPKAPEQNAGTGDGQTADASTNADDANDQPQREVAKAGVGKKGRVKDRSVVTKPITGPANAYWRLQEKVQLEIQIPKLIEGYKANNNFEVPPTHEVFMKEIIEKHNVQLPELPAGHRYVWDPMRGQLMVEG